MTRVALGREILFRERYGQNVESAHPARGREVQLRLHLRYEMQFRNEP